MFQNKNPLYASGAQGIFLGKSVLSVDFFLVGAFQDIIHAHLVKIRQGTEHLRGDHPLTAFIIGVGALRIPKRIADFLLGHIAVFPQIPDSSILPHSDHQFQYEPKG